MRSCNEFSASVQAYAEGRLVGQEKRALEEHLDACPNCRELASDLAKVVGLLRSLPDLPVRSGFTGDVLESIGARARGRGFGLALRMAAGVVLSAGAAGLVYLVLSSAPWREAVPRDLAQAPAERDVSAPARPMAAESRGPAAREGRDAVDDLEATLERTPPAADAGRAYAPAPEGGEGRPEEARELLLRDAAEARPEDFSSTRFAVTEDARLPQPEVAAAPAEGARLAEKKAGAALAPDAETPKRELGALAGAPAASGAVRFGEAKERASYEFGKAGEALRYAREDALAYREEGLAEDEVVGTERTLRERPRMPAVTAGEDIAQGMAEGLGYYWQRGVPADTVVMVLADGESVRARLADLGLPVPAGRNVHQSTATPAVVREIASLASRHPARGRPAAAAAIGGRGRSDGAASAALGSTVREEAEEAAARAARKVRRGSDTAPAGPDGRTVSPRPRAEAPVARREKAGSSGADGVRVAVIVVLVPDREDAVRADDEVPGAAVPAAGGKR